MGCDEGCDSGAAHSGQASTLQTLFPGGNSQQLLPFLLPCLSSSHLPPLSSGTEPRLSSKPKGEVRPRPWEETNTPCPSPMVLTRGSALGLWSRTFTRVPRLAPQGLEGHGEGVTRPRAQAGGGRASAGVPSRWGTAGVHQPVCPGWCVLTGVFQPMVPQQVCPAPSFPGRSQGSRLLGLQGRVAEPPGLPVSPPPYPLRRGGQDPPAAAAAPATGGLATPGS